MSNGLSERTGFWRRNYLWILAGVGVLVAGGIYAIIEIASLQIGVVRLLEAVLAGLVTAIVLGFTVDFVLKQDLVADAFEASVGYVLPDYLQEEMRWIYQQELVAEEYSHTLTITGFSEGRVVLNEQISKTLRNITNRTVTVRPEMGIQEWFHSDRRSKWIKFICKMGNQSFELDPQDASLIKRGVEGYTLSVQIPDKWKLKKDETYTIEAELEEVKHASDSAYSFWGTASKNPSIRVRVPEGFGHHVKFMHRLESEKVDRGGGAYYLAGTLLPRQGIRVRWWQEADRELWISDIGYGEVEN